MPENCFKMAWKSQTGNRLSALLPHAIPTIFNLGVCWNIKGFISTLLLHYGEVIAYTTSSNFLLLNEAVLAFHNVREVSFAGIPRVSSSSVNPFQSMHGELPRLFYGFKILSVLGSCTGIPWGAWNEIKHSVRMNEWMKESDQPTNPHTLVDPN